MHLSLHVHMQLDAINDAFVEARDEIEYAQEVRTGPSVTMHYCFDQLPKLIRAA